MRAVKSKDTTPELLVRRMLFSMGYRYRLHRKNLPGKPDIVFPGRHTAIFINGCFWHGHTCPRGSRVPKSNREYWQNKVARNQQRDARSQADLAGLGWKIAVIWECDCHDAAGLSDRLIEFLGPPKCWPAEANS